MYSLAELEALAQVCRDFDMRLFMDGARLGYGLAAVGADVTLADIARLCDAFYIGGTKVGAFCGEAVVFTKPGLDDHFFTLMKKRGALLAKGRFLGLQFDVLFDQEDGELRYQRIGRHAVELAQRIAEGFRAKGYELAIDSPTNQQFVVLDDETRRAWPNMRRSVSGSARPTAAPSCASPPAGRRAPKAWTSCWRCCRAACHPERSAARRRVEGSAAALAGKLPAGTARDPSTRFARSG